MFRKLTILILCVPAILQLIFPDRNENHALDIANLGIDVVRRECAECVTVLLISSTSDITQDLFLASISLYCRETTILSIRVENSSTSQIGQSAEYNPDITIIFLNEKDSEDIEDIIFAIEIEPFWYNRGKFLVIISGNNDIGDDSLKQLFQSFSTRQALNVLVCCWLDGPKIYSYDPFYENYNIDLTNGTSKLFRRRIRNMNGHAVKLYQLDNVLGDDTQLLMKNGKEVWKGMDGLFYTTLVEVMNATIQVHKLSEDIPDNLIHKADFNISLESFVDLFADTFDFDAIFNCVRILDDNLDHVFMFERHDFVVVVPKGEKIPHYKYLIGILPVNIWCAVMGSIVAVTVTMFCIQKFYYKNSDMVLIFLDNFRILLNESFPERDGTGEGRFVLLGWMAHCIVISALVQSILTTLLVAPQHYQDIDTFEQLYKTNMKLYAPDLIRSQMLNLFKKDKQFVQRLTEVPRHITAYGENLSWIENYRYNSGVIITEEQIFKFKLKNINKIRPNYHVLKESVMPSVKAYIVRKKKLFYDEMVEVLGWIHQAGLNFYWRNHNYGIEDTQTMQKQTDEDGDEDDFQPVTLEHLEPAFMVLVSGVLLAGITFCCELLIYYRGVHKNRRN